MRGALWKRDYTSALKYRGPTSIISSVSVLMRAGTILRRCRFFFALARRGPIDRFHWHTPLRGLLLRFSEALQELLRRLDDDAGAPDFDRLGLLSLR